MREFIDDKISLVSDKKSKHLYSSSSLTIVKDKNKSNPIINDQKTSKAPTRTKQTMPRSKLVQKLK